MFYTKPKAKKFAALIKDLRTVEWEYPELISQKLNKLNSAASFCF